MRADRHVWKAVQEEIASRITEHQFETWFRQVNFDFSGPEQVSVSVPNRFYESFLKHRYYTVILASIESVTSLQRPHLEFRVDESLEHDSPNRTTAARTPLETDGIANNPFENEIQSRLGENSQSESDLAPSQSSNPDKRIDPGALDRGPLDQGTFDGNELPATAPTLGAHSPQSWLSTPQLPHNLPLNPNYIFDSFVVGPSNSLAHAAARAVAENPGISYNPLFIHGNVGLGKTHLLQAVARSYLARGMGRLVYVSCSNFTNDYISAVRDNNLSEFREKYANVDALLIDDIQFLADKDSTQEEFFHTFNTVYNEQKQIFLTSDSLPSAIEGLSDRLVSRFKLGLVAHLGPPQFETRVAILMQKARFLGLALTQEIAEFVAHQITDNVRELEGAILRLHSHVSIEQKPLTLDLVRNSLVDILGEEQSTAIDLPKIQQVVLEEFHVKASDLHSRKRTRSIVLPRQVCMYLARLQTNLSLEEIGDYFGGRDHSTVMHAVEKITELRETDIKLRKTLENLESRLGVTSG